MPKHLEYDERKRIEFLLSCGAKVSHIAAELGRPSSTVVREIITRRTNSDKRYACSNRLCVHFDTCKRRIFTGFRQNLRKNQTRCFEFCPDFFEAHCNRHTQSPYVCNGCANEHNCPLKKKFYFAKIAQANYEGTLVNSRQGVQIDEEKLKEMNEILSLCIRKGQSVRNIIVNNPTIFEDVKERTIYDWINNGLLEIKRHEQPFACSRKPRQKTKKEIKTTAKCRVGRTYDEMKAWLGEHPEIIPCELDTVIGSISGKVLYTMIFPETGLSLAFIRNSKTKQTTVRLFNMLWEMAGKSLFQKLFAAILTDNGGEFANPYMIENWRPDQIHNPTRIESRGIRVWFTDPYSPTQKPHIERVHEEFQRILQKGVSFNSLTQESVDLVMSHINSYTRLSIFNKTPWELFVDRYGSEGRDFLAKLNIHKVQPNDVTLRPNLLGETFEKLAEKVILRKAGVLPTTGTGK